MDQIQSNSQQAVRDQILLENYPQCPQHKGFQINSIKLDRFSEEECVLKCSKCIQDVQISNTISLSDLLASDSKTVFKYWPILNNDSQIYEQLLAAQKVFGDLNNLKQNQQSIRSDQDIYDQILNEYNRLSQKEKLKEIIRHTFQNLQDKNSALKQIIKNNFENQENSKRSLLQLIAKSKEFATNLNNQEKNQKEPAGLIKDLLAFDQGNNSSQSQQNQDAQRINSNFSDQHSSDVDAQQQSSNRQINQAQENQNFSSKSNQNQNLEISDASDDQQLLDSQANIRFGYRTWITIFSFEILKY
ncbi:hypothetical protein ABPG72_011576 [Tetrahymena utriculariae]